VRLRGSRYRGNASRIPGNIREYIVLRKFPPLHSRVTRKSMSLGWSKLQAESPFLVLDGAMGTELERQGIPVTGHPLWSAWALLEFPQAVHDIHLAYAQAGADILTTATYQACLPGLVAAGLSVSRAAACLTSGVTLAARAIETHLTADGRQTPRIAASLGPYGAYRADRSEYTGEYGVDRAALYEFHAPQLDILARSDADILAWETIPSLTEGEVLVELLAGLPEKPAWVSFTSQDGRHTSAGEPMRDCVQLCAAHSHIWAGVNCVQPHRIASLLQADHTGRQGLRVVYPNGEPHRMSAAERRLTGPQLAEMAAAWVDAGVGVVGGCCGTAPAWTRTLARLKASLAAGGH